MRPEQREPSAAQVTAHLAGGTVPDQLAQRRVQPGPVRRHPQVAVPTVPGRWARCRRPRGRVVRRAERAAAQPGVPPGRACHHSVFWANLSPDGGGDPDGELHAALVEHFGSLQAFRAHFTAAALQLQGSGWAVLAWDSLGQRLIVEQLQDHQTNLAFATIPVLLLDMWEHAYYLDYQATKADYVAAWWNVVHWTDAAAAQRAAGVLAAKHRGDGAGVARLMDSFGSDREMAGGCLLLAELTLGLYRQENGQTMEEAVQDLCLHLAATIEVITTAD